MTKTCFCCTSEATVRLSKNGYDYYDIIKYVQIRGPCGQSYAFLLWIKNSWCVKAFPLLFTPNYEKKFDK